MKAYAQRGDEVIVGRRLRSDTLAASATITMERYVVGEVIGEGSFGQVHIANDTADSTTVG